MPRFRVAALDKVADLDLLDGPRRAVGHLDRRPRHEAVAEAAGHPQLLPRCGEAASDGAGSAEVGVEGVEAELAFRRRHPLDLAVAHGEGRVELVGDVVDGLAERQRHRRELGDGQGQVERADDAAGRRVQEPLAHRGQHRVGQRLRLVLVEAAAADQVAPQVRVVHLRTTDAVMPQPVLDQE